jgi:hypothetical protein
MQKATFSLLLTLAITPLCTGFVLLGKNKSTLPVTESNPEIDFVYDPNGEVPPMSKKEELLEGQYASLSDQELFPILLQIAMDQWNNVRGSYLRMKLVPSDSTPQRSREDNMNVILAEKNTNASTAAFATPESDPDNPTVISDCDISVSLTDVSASSLLETITHEIGHCVGLGHPHNNYGAIMSYSRGGSSYKLGADDKAGTIFLYPDPQYVDGSPRELIGCGNIGLGGSSPLGTFFLFAIPGITIFCGMKIKSKKSKR